MSCKKEKTNCAARKEKTIKTAKLPSSYRSRVGRCEAGSFAAKVVHPVMTARTGTQTTTTTTTTIATTMMATMTMIAVFQRLSPNNPCLLLPAAHVLSPFMS
jgi:hypothetical protein